jgi:hypothetical protein
LAELDREDPPAERIPILLPDEPGDPASHVVELQLYWPDVGAEQWAAPWLPRGGEENG